jgi:hypothetical protein
MDCRLTTARTGELKQTPKSVSWKFGKLVILLAVAAMVLFASSAQAGGYVEPESFDETKRVQRFYVDSLDRGSRRAASDELVVRFSEQSIFSDSSSSDLRDQVSIWLFKNRFLVDELASIFSSEDLEGFFADYPGVQIEVREILTGSGQIMLFVKNEGNGSDLDPSDELDEAFDTLIQLLENKNSIQSARVMMRAKAI